VTFGNIQAFAAIAYAIPGIAKNITDTYANGNKFHFVVCVPRNLENLNGIFLIYGIGYHMHIPIMLKNKCASATCHASTGCDTATDAAQIPVHVVPMFAPSVNGYICSNDIIPTAASGVNADVVIDDDCTINVINIPIRIDTYPLNSNAFLNKSVNGPLIRDCKCVMMRNRQQHIPASEIMTRNNPVSESV
jgi:hypothetical protein